MSDLSEEHAGELVAVVPAYDVADTLGETLDALSDAGRVDRIIVVDDGSRDATAEIAGRRPVELLRHEVNRGKGAAMATAVASLGPGVRAVAFVDGDLGSTASELGPLFDLADQRPDALVVGIPLAAAGRGGFGLVRDLAAEAIATATGARLRAPLSGQRVVPMPLAAELDYAARFGVETAMSIDAALHGVPVLEVDVAVDHRHLGRSAAGLAHRARQGADITRALVPRLGLLTTGRLVVLVAARSAGRALRGSTHRFGR